ncbi:hypothetical protein PJI17_22335 [Mycobacterium kansasii]
MCRWVSRAGYAAEHRGAAGSGAGLFGRNADPSFPVKSTTRDVMRH